MSTHHYSKEDAFAFLKKNGTSNFSENDFNELILSKKIKPRFLFQGILVNSFLDPNYQFEEERNTLEMYVDFLGYITPADFKITYHLAQLNVNDSKYIREINIFLDYEYIRLDYKDSDDIVSLLQQLNSINESSSFEIQESGSDQEFKENFGIKLSSNNCRFSKAELENIFLTSTLAEIPNHVAELQEHEKESLDIIEILVDFIVKKTITKIKTKNQNIEAISSQDHLVNELDRIYKSDSKNMSKSRLEKTFGFANKFKKTGKYPDINNEGANRVIISSMLNFIFSRVTISSRTYQPIIIETHDQLIDELLSRYKRKNISKASLKEKFQDIQNDNSLINNK